MTGQQFLDNIRVGMIVHVRSKTWFGRAIQWSLTKWVQRIYGKQYTVWGNHDALIVRGPEGRLYVGEALAGEGSVPTCISEYVIALDEGECDVRLFDPVVSDLQRNRASNHWWMKVKGTPYDYAAFPRLLIKSVLLDLCPRAAGWKWANWCTEGVAKSYLEGGIDIFQTNNPTPLTTEQVAGVLPQRPGLLITLTEVNVKKGGNNA